MVNRGWISHTHPLAKAAGSARSRKTDTIGPTVTQKTDPTLIRSVVVLVKTADKPGSFTPPNEPQNRFYYFVDPQQMAANLNTLPVLVEMTNDNALPEDNITPIPGQCNTSLPNNHLNYVLTWSFILSSSSSQLFSRCSVS